MRRALAAGETHVKKSLKLLLQIPPYKILSALANATDTDLLPTLLAPKNNNLPANRRSTSATFPAVNEKINRGQARECVRHLL